MAKTQREMRLRHARPIVDTQAALALARSHAGSKALPALSSPARQKAVREYPQLRVVERQRRLAGFRISHKMFLAYVVGFLALFAAVVMRAEMAATQLRLNALNAQLSTLETQHLMLDVQLSSLQSPSRIVSYAEKNLGMVYPTQVGYLGAAPAKALSQSQPSVLTQQVMSAPNTLFAPPGEAGGGAPTRPLPNAGTTLGSSKGSATAASQPAKSAGTKAVQLTPPAAKSITSASKSG
ncbi:MAG: hypothetical protein M0Z39_02965 [Actinomycetota bacterium]|nr:hypothetical protein [Actinomycetota bacterium]